MVSPQFKHNFILLKYCFQILRRKCEGNEAIESTYRRIASFESETIIIFAAQSSNHRFLIGASLRFSIAECFIVIELIFTFLYCLCFFYLCICCQPFYIDSSCQRQQDSFSISRSEFTLCLFSDDYFAQIRQFYSFRCQRLRICPCVSSIIWQPHCRKRLGQRR